MTARIGFLPELIFIGILIAAIANWAYTAQPNAIIGSPRHPVYSFSLVIYAIQGWAVAHYFRRRVDGLRVMAFASCSLVSSVSVYELLFKLSFPLLDPKPGRVNYLFTDDLFFLILFLVAAPSYLVSKDFWRLRVDNRPFVAACLVAAASWISWWWLCFPLDVQAYEAHFMPCPWAHNVVTKALIASLYVSVLDRSPVGARR